MGIGWDYIILFVFLWGESVCIVTLYGELHHWAGLVVVRSLVISYHARYES